MPIVSPHISSMLRRESSIRALVRDSANMILRSHISMSQRSSKISRSRM
ncbi:MAG: hypothetical protein ACK55Z_34405 [bacterium]